MHWPIGATKRRMTLIEGVVERIAEKNEGKEEKQEKRIPRPRFLEAGDWEFRKRQPKPNEGKTIVYWPPTFKARTRSDISKSGNGPTSILISVPVTMACCRERLRLTGISRKSGQWMCAGRETDMEEVGLRSDLGRSRRCHRNDRLDRWPEESGDSSRKWPPKATGVGSGAKNQDE